MQSPISVAQLKREPRALSALNDDLARLTALGRRRSLEPFAGLDWVGAAIRGERVSQS